MDIVAKLSGQAWVAVGDQANWERGLENGIWGIVPHLERLWNKIQKDDLVLLYCKAPVTRVFGAGIIRSKFKQTTPLWKEEIEERRCLWPFRFEFDVLHLLPFGQWHSMGVSARDFRLAILAGLNGVEFKKALEIYGLLLGAVKEEVVAEEQIRTVLYEIGRMQRMIVESDYPVDGFAIDVIWKRLVRSVPTFAFSVDLKGNFQSSLQTLKHAYDLWNTRPFLVTERAKIDKAHDLTSGIYHELEPHLKILSAAQVHDLHASKKSYYDLEERYGLR
jgi:hypothetical protein